MDKHFGSPLPPPGRAPAQEWREQPRARDNRQPNDSVLREPSRIPRTTSMVRDEPASAEGPPSMDGLVPGGVLGVVPSSVLTEIARAVPPTVVKPAPPPELRISSGVAAGMLILDQAPQYPRVAMQARIQGMVVLQAVIGKGGPVQALHVVSGHPCWRRQPSMRYASGGTSPIS